MVVVVKDELEHEVYRWIETDRPVIDINLPVGIVRMVAAMKPSPILDFLMSWLLPFFEFSRFFFTFDFRVFIF